MLPVTTEVSDPDPESIELQRGSVGAVPGERKR
jgi:hypothetical protein